MTVLVTGGMGYIGSHTSVELLEQGMDVVVVDNLVNSSAEAGKRVEQITGRPLKFYQMDVRDRAGLDRIFTEQKIDCVIHFAGLKAVGESVQMPLEYYDNNLGSTITLCEAMRDHGVRQIIFSSSATVYSGDNEMPLLRDVPHRQLHESLWLDEVRLRADPARLCRGRPELVGRAAALLQPHRRAPERPHRRGPARRAEQPHALYLADGHRPAEVPERLWRRL